MGVPCCVLQIQDSHAWLKGDSTDRPHPSRMVHDVDISAGYMHSGYPVRGGGCALQHRAS